jgi:hypothetical protein
MAKRPENVIRGSFTARGAKEWAILCSVHGVSEIVVFRSNSAEPISRFSELEDYVVIQEVEPGRMGYSRLIATGRRSAAGLNPIHDIFLEKASTIWVRMGQRWVATPGAD